MNSQPQSQSQTRMTPTEYVAAAMFTEAPVDEAYTRIGIAGNSVIRMLHATIGMCTETGELQHKFTEHDALNRDTVNELSHFNDEHKGVDA